MCYYTGLVVIYYSYHAANTPRNVLCLILEIFCFINKITNSNTNSNITKNMKLQNGVTCAS